MVVTNPPLCEAARDGDTRACERLLRDGADVNGKNSVGCAPLHYAAWRNHLGICKLLLHADAEAGIKDIDDETPLHYAIRDWNLEVCKLLIDAGAEINAENTDAAALLYIAVVKGDLDHCKSLVDAGTEVNAKYKSDWTLLHIAAQEGHLEVCKLLIGAGVEVNAKDKDGKTPQQMADNVEVREYFYQVIAKAYDERRKALVAGAIDLSAEVKKSGFSSISEYVQRGSNNLRDRLLFGEYPYSASNVKEDGSESSVTITINTGFFATKIGEITSPFPDVVRSFREPETPLGKIVSCAFLTKDYELRRIEAISEIERGSYKNGFLCARFQNPINVMAFTISGKTASILELLREKDNYRVIMVFSGLGYSSKTAPIVYHLININETLRTDDCVDTNNKVVPNPFVTDESETLREVSADVIKIEIVKLPVE